MSICCTAVSQRRLLRLDYEGHTRVVAPAAHGVLRSTGNEVLRAYQISGSSSSGKVPDWRLFQLDRIAALELLEPFDDDPPFYRRGDRHLAAIHCQL